MNRKLSLYKIDPTYLKYMHSIDSRISVKFNNRPFVGIITMINGVEYVLPLTSQTTKERVARGKKKRSSMITTFVRDSSGEEIANILHNNMFPVRSDVYEELNIDAAVDTYESNEIRYIRKHSTAIISKAEMVNEKRKNSPNPFLIKTCCDFELLEKNYLEFE